MTKLSLIQKEKEIKKAVRIFHAIDHSLRKEILKLLEQKEQATVTEIYVNLRIEQSVASQQLKILRDAKVVEKQRDGKTSLYKPNYSRIAKLEKILAEIDAD